MNKLGKSGVFGFALLIVVFVFIITSFVTIEPMKEALNATRSTSSLNCPRTSGFNQTAYDEDSKFNRLVRRPTCFVTGLSLVYFIGAFLIAVLVWLVTNWRKVS